MTICNLSRRIVDEALEILLHGSGHAGVVLSAPDTGVAIGLVGDVEGDIRHRF